MFKLSTVAAFVTSMLVTTFLTATSCLGMYLYMALHKEIQQGHRLLRLDQQKAKLNERTYTELAEKLTDVA